MKKPILILLFISEICFSQTTIQYNRYLRSNFGSQTMWDGVTINIYGITNALSDPPVIPAPTIYCNEGDSVIINALSISQLHHHTIHLHGLDVDTRNDGDPATSFYLSHLQDTTYSFKATHAGTYIYHCHVEDVVHVQMGMYGSIIVKAAGGANTAWTGGPAFDKEYNFLTSEIDRSWHDSVPVHDSIAMALIVPTYLPEYFLINGKSEWQLDADSSLRVEGPQDGHIYLRLTNLGYYDNKYVFPPSLQAQIIDSDGRPLPAPVSNDTVYIAPGERYGVMINPNAQLIDSIALSYINLNTNNVENTQYIDVNIIGYIGLEKDENKYFKLFPNPANQLLNIQLSDTELIGSLISFTNAGGQKLLSQIITTQNQVIDISTLAPGVYFVCIDDNKDSIQKIIVR